MHDSHPEPSVEALLMRDAGLRQLAVRIAGAQGDDALQESWLSAHRSSHVPHSATTRRAWVAASVRNTARNLLRTERRRTVRERCVARREVDATSDPFDLAAYEERRAALVREVQRLPEAQRDAIIERFWEGLEPAEIAQIHAESPAAVRQRLHRAITTLRERMDRASGGARAAWLGPLLGAPTADAPVPDAPTPDAPTPDAPTAEGSTVPLTGAGSAGGWVVFGGIMVKKWLGGVTVLAFVTLAGVAGMWLWSRSAQTRGPSVPTLAEQRVADSSTSIKSESAARDIALRSDVVGFARPQLIDGATSAPIGGVAYWRDERPFLCHPLRVPDGVSRTDADGRFDLSSARGQGEFLWFEIDASLHIAVSRDDWSNRMVVQLPRTRVMNADILGLPADEAWTVEVCPAWIADDGSLIHGLRHLESPENDASGAEDGVVPVWILRGRSKVSGNRGAAHASFRVIEDLPLTCYFYAGRFVVEPERLDFAFPMRHVVAHAGEDLLAYRFEILEDGGQRRSTIDGVVQRVQGRAWIGEAFEQGHGTCTQRRSTSREDASLVIVLRDGSYFPVDLSEDRFSQSQDLSLERRRAKRARTLRLQLLDDAMADAAWESMLVEVDGNLRYATDFESFLPEAPERDTSLAVWRHQGELVVGTSERDAELGAVILVDEAGRVALRDGDRIRWLPSQPLAPYETQALIDRWSPSGADRIFLDLSARMTGRGFDCWVPLRSIRLHEVEGFGWRCSWSFILYEHVAVPAQIELSAPQGVELRCRATVLREGRSTKFDLPIRRLR